MIFADLCVIFVSTSVRACWKRSFPSRINIPFYSSHRRPLNKAVTPPWMNCTSVAETAQWSRQRTRGGSRARNRACMQSHSRDRLGGGGGGGGASLQFRALARKPACTPTPVVEVYAWWFPMLSSRRTWQKVGQLRAPGTIGSGTGASERGADYGRSFPATLFGALLDSTCS